MIRRFLRWLRRRPMRLTRETLERLEPVNERPPSELLERKKREDRMIEEIDEYLRITRQHLNSAKRKGV